MILFEEGEAVYEYQATRDIEYGEDLLRAELWFDLQTNRHCQRGEIIWRDFSINLQRIVNERVKRGMISP